MHAVIIIPTYNEKGNIEPLIEVLEKDIFPQITDYEMSILIADDSSPDGTGELVKELMGLL
jgi:dolichol-phosphate mannosyltransferase